MKRTLSLALMCTSLSLVAATEKAVKNQSNSKICFYDPEQLAGQSEEWRALVMDVDKKYQKEAEKIKSAEAQFQKEVQAFNAKVAVLSESSRESESERLERTKADLEHKAKRMVDEYQNERQKVNVRFYKKLDEGIVSFLDTQANLEAAVPKTPGVFLKKGVNDYTTAIANHMNKEYASRAKAAVPAANSVVVAKN